MYIPDNYDAYDAYERERERRADEILEDLPKCDWCGEPIEEDYFYDIGENVCEECMDDCRKFVGWGYDTRREEWLVVNTESVRFGERKLSEGKASASVQTQQTAVQPATETTAAS